MGGLSAVSLEGPKAVGKTETALRRANTVYRLDDPGQLEIARAAPERIITGVPPILVDAWQRLPSSWDLVRRAVDQDPSPARFLLTGSAAPHQTPTHSGAGRIVTVRMRPMSLAERLVATPTVSLADLLSGSRPPLTGTTELSLLDYTQEITRSGFPAIRQLSGRLLLTQLDGYLQRIVERDFLELGHRVRNRDAASPGEANKPAKTTTIPYRATLENLWMIEQVPAWAPTRNRLRRLAASPVHQLADPALTARLLGADTAALINNIDTGPPVPRDGTLLGALFQSLVTLSVRTYAQAAEANVGHLRTRGAEHEIDLIVERSDNRIVALEIKLAATATNADTRHLKWLARSIGDDLLDAAIITTGKHAYRRQDGIGIIPAALLTA